MRFKISIHAPRTGSDFYFPKRRNHQMAFQSTLPVRGATCQPGDILHHIGISIHAPRTGSDLPSRYPLA